MRRLILIVFQLSILDLAVASPPGNNKPVILVNDITDEIQTIPWRHDLNLEDAVVQRKIPSGFTAQVEVIANGTLQAFSACTP